MRWSSMIRVPFALFVATSSRFASAGGDHGHHEHEEVYTDISTHSVYSTLPCYLNTTITRTDTAIVNTTITKTDTDFVHTTITKTDTDLTTDTDIVNSTITKVDTDFITDTHFVSVTKTLSFTISLTETDTETVETTETETITTTTTTTLISTEIDPCPSSCSISAGTVTVFFWPESQTFSYPSTYSDPELDYVFTSPSVYMLIPTAQGLDSQGPTGPSTDTWILALDLEEVSTIFDGTQTRQLTLADLGTDCPQSADPTAIATLDDSRCAPILAAPKQVSSWAYPCNACGPFGLFDPPYAVPTLTGELIETTTVVDTTVISEPSSIVETTVTSETTPVAPTPTLPSITTPTVSIPQSSSDSSSAIDSSTSVINTPSTIPSPGEGSGNKKSPSVWLTTVVGSFLFVALV